MLAAARGPKTKDKKTPTTEEKWQQESRQKKNITEQKTDTRPDPDPSDTKTKRNRFKIRQQPPQQQQQQGRNSRTANRGPGHSKLASAGINGSAPVFTASNGHDQVPAVGVVVEKEEEEDDLSPVDMSQVSSPHHVVSWNVNDRDTHMALAARKFRDLKQLSKSVIFFCGSRIFPLLDWSCYVTASKASHYTVSFRIKQVR